MGVVIDGVPPRLELDVEAIQEQLDRRRPGQSELVTPRKEEDRVQILAGLFEGRTTGAPLCLVIRNRDARPGAYDHLKDVYRPGHGDLTWEKKYGLRDHRGSGRASGRETSARVAAAAVARQILATQGVSIIGHVIEVAGVRAHQFDAQEIERNPARCADAAVAGEMAEAIVAAKADGDSVGGLVEVRAEGVPPGWGDPVFGKLDGLIAGALMGIGAVKGVEIGDGFALARQRGSQANDELTPAGFATNHAGGILGGISNGDVIVARAAVKPTSSINKAQQTVNRQGQPVTLQVEGRHDPCIAPRLVPVAEAMVALVLVDTYLAQLSLAAATTDDGGEQV
jgi:chorismate synthase